MSSSLLFFLSFPALPFLLFFLPFFFLFRLLLHHFSPSLCRFFILFLPFSSLRFLSTSCFFIYSFCFFSFPSFIYLLFILPFSSLRFVLSLNLLPSFSSLHLVYLTSLLSFFISFHSISRFVFPFFYFSFFPFLSFPSLSLELPFLRFRFLPFPFSFLPDANLSLPRQSHTSLLATLTLPHWPCNNHHRPHWKSTEEGNKLEECKSRRRSEEAETEGRTQRGWRKLRGKSRKKRERENRRQREKDGMGKMRISRSVFECISC